MQSCSDKTMEFHCLKHIKSMHLLRRNQTWRASAFLVTPFILCNHKSSADEIHVETNQSLTNWSSTHTCSPNRVYYPSSPAMVASLLQSYNSPGNKIRAIGTGLSPNGIGFSDKSCNLISVADIDHIIVNVDKCEVTVGAGATVNAVLKELRKHGLTLQNFSSIQEQQIGGWTQVAAHGTGCTLPTVDEMILRYELVTPSLGLLSLSNEEKNPFLANLFSMAKVGLGSLGIVTELTLKCIPELTLKETTSVLNRNRVDTKQHIERLRKFRHVRYMWVPYTETVISVVSNPFTDDDLIGNKDNNDDKSVSYDGKKPTSYPTESLVQLAASIPDIHLPVLSSSASLAGRVSYLQSLSFSQLRDLLLDVAPLDTTHVRRVNEAESHFWRATATEGGGQRVGNSVDILGFDCGGEQWVYEVCLPMGSLDEASEHLPSRDIEFAQRLLELVETHNIPAPSPIEQRWSASSTAPMSPAYTPDSVAAPNQVYTWVGIIMYLPPSQTSAQRRIITDRFREYCTLIEPLVKEFNGYPHWAKVEIPRKVGHDRNTVEISTAESMGTEHEAPVDEARLNDLRLYLRKRYPLDSFNSYRAVLDPHQILSNQLVESLLSDSHSS